MTSLAAAQSHQPADAEKQQIRARMAELEKLLEGVQGHPLVEDVEVYHKAAAWILRYEREEFYRPEYAANTLAALGRGMARAREMAAGKPSWPHQKGRLARAYRSRVDGSVQPYGLIIPESYDGRTPVRLNVWLHGRGSTLNEVSFLAEHDSDKPVPPDQDFIQLDVFGRTNNAYRWAGETDVFEALESVEKRYRIDPERIVLRGFSMGGAGAWHVGLHHPDRWAGVEAGAGFTETHRYAKQGVLPPYQEATLHIYDAVDYALNAWNLPMVGYGGDQDPQLQASVNIRERLAGELPPRLLFLVGPKTGHRFHPGSQRESAEFLRRHLPRHRPERIRFATYTTRYNRAFGMTIEGLEKHYERAEVDARGGEIHTRNIARLSVAAPVAIDGQRFPAGSTFEKVNGRWQAARVPSGLRKRHGLQGPIDDAFMDSFLCVRPTGTPKYPRVTGYAGKVLDQFLAEWAKFLRGDARIKDDTAVTAEDIASHNLILFGDPGSNRLIGRMGDRLPAQWGENRVPALIYPNPLNPNRYVVINSGHTFHEPEFRGTNALLYPRLGDWAVLRLNGEIEQAGLFDESWRPVR